jgi:uncharacterized protein (TIGR02996 family)
MTMGTQMRFLRHALPPKLTMEMGAEERMLFKAVWDCPWDGWARGGYADWLDEHGRPVEAALHRTLRADVTDEDVRTAARAEYSKALHDAGHHDAADMVFSQLAVESLGRSYGHDLGNLDELRMRDRYLKWVADLLTRVDRWAPTLPALFGRTKINAKGVYTGAATNPTPLLYRADSPPPIHLKWKGGMVDEIGGIEWRDWVGLWRGVMYWEPVRSVKLSTHPTLLRTFDRDAQVYSYRLSAAVQGPVQGPDLPEPATVLPVPRLMEHNSRAEVNGVRAYVRNELLARTWPTIQWDVSGLRGEPPFTDVA